MKVVVFDCDGVMFDTIRVNTEYYNRILARLGKPAMTPDQFAFVHKHTVAEGMRHLFPDPAELKAALSFRSDINYRDLIPFMEMEPSLKPLLTRLKPRYQTAIATNRSDTMPLILSLHGLEDAFDCVVTALDVSRPKPDPEGLEKIQHHFGVDAGEMIYIGDTVFDQQAAMAAGVPFVAYGDPALDADLHISALSELMPLLVT
ncbi:MAG: hypothetical protein CSA22_01125 [Deltaproteobacteria bacterium]|nr:MAG: hypothetical protein CSA22_01125 [Deltaproteobacteria bacterium]